LTPNSRPRFDEARLKRELPGTCPEKLDRFEVEDLIGLMLPAHIEFLLIGWTVQLTGVAFWILPRLPAGGGRGAVAPAWLAFIRLNAGLWLVALASVFSPSDAARVVGRLAEAVGAIAFGVHAWRRIRRAGIARIG
jgi:hypothetical protein